MFDGRRNRQAKIRRAAWPPFDEKEMKTMVFDQASGTRPLPNLEKLKVFDGYYAWHREQAKRKNSGGTQR